MIEKRPSAERAEVEITFRVPSDSHSGTVFVVGDFNGWDEDATPLVERDEWLEARVTVPTGGRFAFRYRTTDNRWFNDESADDYDPNEFGGSNGVIVT